MNYNGFFNSLDGRNFEVRLISDRDSSTYTEIILAGDSPFRVVYNTSNTPFDAVRTSTASINIVSDTYMEDILSECAQGTAVELWDISNPNAHVLEWIGYLTPKVFDAGYEDCYETFSLEAADCISSLQYLDYEPMSGGGLTNMCKIIGQICDACGLLEGFYWTRSKKVGNSVLMPQHLTISEQNFFSSDTDEPWKLSEVLEEICKYLGFTCLQWKKRMYFIDYQHLEDNNDLYMSYYPKASNYNQGTATHAGGIYTVTENSYRGNGATISFEPIFNKVVVNANMYAADNYFPNPFDDNLLSNRIDSANFYTSITLTTVTPDNAQYPHGSASFGWGQGVATEQTGDSKYTYTQRIYDNKYWESVYSSDDGTIYDPIDSVKKSSDITRYIRGGTIIDLGVVRNTYRDEYQQLVVPNKMDYTRYLCICERYRNEFGSVSVPVFQLKTPFNPKVLLGDDAFLVLNCSCLFERYYNRNYINPSWTNTECSLPAFFAGSRRNSVARPHFKFHVGDSGWSSSLQKWVAVGSTYDSITPQMRWDSNKSDFWNKEISILNNISWEDKVNAEGIKIPLSGVDMTKPITFVVYNPPPSFYGNTGNPDFQNVNYETNAYCWLKDLSIKCMYAGQDEDGNDSDVVYENVLSECSVNDLSEITVKINSFKKGISPSYSSVAYNNSEKTTFLSGVTEASLSNNAQLPEENIIEKYVHQYSTPTKKITLTLPDTINPMNKLKGVDVDNPNVGYVQLGTEIDYVNGNQTITVIEKEK